MLRKIGAAAKPGSHRPQKAQPKEPKKRAPKNRPGENAGKTLDTASTEGPARPRYSPARRRREGQARRAGLPPPTSRARRSRIAALAMERALADLGVTAANSWC